MYLFIGGCECNTTWWNDSTSRESAQQPSSPQASTPFWILTVNSTSDWATPLRAVGGLHKCFVVYSCLLHNKSGKSERKIWGRTRKRPCASVCSRKLGAGWLNVRGFFFFFSHSVFFSLTLDFQLLSCISVKRCLQAYCAQNRMKEAKTAHRRKSANAAHPTSMTSLDSH